MDERNLWSSNINYVSRFKVFVLLKALLYKKSIDEAVKQKYVV